MPFPTLGGVVLGGVTFSTDPDPYQNLNWKRRASRHMTIGGGAVIQDFGVVQVDNMLKLGSGNSRVLDDPTMQALHALYRTQGVAFPFTDWLGNAFTVFINDFVVWPFKQGGDAQGNTVRLYFYTMDLWTVSIQTLFGVAYTGP